MLLISITRQVIEMTQPKLAENFIKKIRRFTDNDVPWGTDRAIDVARKK